MPTKRIYRDGELFIAKMEQALDEGGIEFVEANMPRLERLIARLQDRQYEVAQIMHRAMMVRERHEPRADRRASR